jgi:CheY-like chemotaxis protein
VADDEPNFNQVLRAELERRGHQAFAAYDGHEAVEAVRQRDLDLVLLDCRIPLVEGGDVLRRVRDLRPDLPVIVISAYDSPEARTEAESAGAHGYLVKPFDMDELLDMVAAVLAERSGAAPTEVDADQVLALIKRGQALTIEVPAGEAAGEYEVWAEAEPEAAVAVSMPRSGGRAVHIPLRTEVYLTLGLSGGFYQLETAVIGLSLGSERPILLLQRPTAAWSDQRRRYARHDLRFPVVCRVVEDGNEYDLEAQAESLSLGGVRVATSQPIVRGAQVTVESDQAPGGGSLSRVGRVVWTTREQSDGVCYRAGIQFLDAPPAAPGGVN